MRFESACGEYLQHVDIVGHHVGFELNYSMTTRAAAQMRYQQWGHAASLVPVAHRKCHFRSTISSPDIASNTFNTLAIFLAENSHSAYMLIEIELSKSL